MDVKYSPEDWQGMKDGLDTLTGGKYGGGAKSGLLQLNDLLEDIESKINDKDSDGSISFSHSSQKSKIDELFSDYQKLSDFCLKAGGLVEDHIDNPFYKKLDAFADKMEGMSIHNYKTKNRIGSKETTYVGYGMNKTAVQQDKEEITVNDIFKDSAAFDHVLSEEYKAFKAQNPDIDLNYEDYSKAIFSARGFQYESVSDVQKSQELWRDLIIGGGIIVLTVFCAPAGIVAAGAYGTAQITSAATGKDWMTKRELNTGERFERGAFGALDMLPAAGLAGKAFKSTATIGEIAAAGKAKNVVQSLKESKNTWSNRMRVNSLKAQDKLNDAGYAIKKQFAKSADALSDIARGSEVGAGGTLARKGSDFYGHVNDAHQASKAKIQESIQRVEKGIETGKGVAKSSGKVYPTRQIDPVKEAHIIDRVKELRGKLTSGYKKSGNFALAEVDVNGIDKSEFFAQSSIDELTDSLKERVPNISLKPENPMFHATEAPDKKGSMYLRDSDTEYKILNDIASRLGNNTEVKGKIKLFTELDTCDSCSQVIAEFAKKYKNIELEVIHSNGQRLKPN